ncbi:ImmA/IrrE family metallo-endopeptidase [Microbacterium sp. YY-01]|uniref:ImmA/IrrE family metallo-endopeptidase n=1 Tax=Microbacterium sp. YY-01 TaxID=3421634 RepID=UPI003D17E5F2
MGLDNEMWDLADQLGLRVIEYHGAHVSGYYPDEHIIRLTPGMSQRSLRSVLAHEIGHHQLGHHPTTDRILRARQETAAQDWAAHALISPSDYAEAEHIRDGHVPSMAHDLRVSTELVLVYREALLRTDTSVYVAPRMGVGQFAHRLEVA